MPNAREHCTAEKSIGLFGVDIFERGTGEESEVEPAREVNVNGHRYVLAASLEGAADE
ncbi:MAG: hypothetical protein AAGI54_08185 [Planctomycetota bacterium]